jgi:putative tryptophan/tyrosine transport system substrate-binding protein
VTTTIPIVFKTGTDPVATRLIPRLAMPGGNVTGVKSLNSQVGPKRLALLSELVPTATSIALLVNPTNPLADSVATEARTVARSQGLQFHLLDASTDRDFDTVFTTLSKLRVGGLVVAADAFFANRSEQLTTLAVRLALPAIFYSRDFAMAGGLLSYGGTVAESHRQAGIYTGRILNGEKPANLQMQQVTKVELTINLKTAKALGLTVPATLLARADEVIE